jgi:hypothetical protein
MHVQAAELTDDDYLKASTDVDPVLMAALADVEKQLLHRLSVINVVVKS